MSAHRVATIAAVVAAVALAGTALGEAQQWGQLRLTGTAESDVGKDILTVGSKKFGTFSFGSRYAPNLDGYVLDPRLLVFSYSGSWMDRYTDASGGQSSSLTVEPYRLGVNLFPYGLHSFSLTGGRTRSDFDLQAERISTTTDTLGAAWAYRGGPRTPEAALRVTRETVDELQLDGLTQERVRSTLGLRLHKDLDRFRPTLNYSVEQTSTGGTAPDVGLLPDGLTHRVQLDDRIRLGPQAIVVPVLDFTSAPALREGNASATLSGPLSPTLDASTGLRYSLSESDSEIETVRTHTTATQGQITKRFTDDLVLTAIGNGTFVTGGPGGDAWSAGLLGALRAAPWPHLRGVGDYGLQLSTSDRATSLMHRGHLNAVSTLIPRHSVTGDYFVTMTDVGRSFVSQTAALGVTSEAIPLTTVAARYSVELQEGLGERERRVASLGADVRPAPALLTRASVEHFQEHARGGGRPPREETGVVGEGGVTLRVLDWLQGTLKARYGRKEVLREDRAGQMGESSATASVDVSRGALLLHLEGFVESDQDAREQRQGGRGTLSFRFRVWTVSADFEVSQLTLQGLDTGRDRFFLRISRPLNFRLW